jgi:Protein of unknown function (DUF3263)
VDPRRLDEAGVVPGARRAPEPAGGSAAESVAEPAAESVVEPAAEPTDDETDSDAPSTVDSPTPAGPELDERSVRILDFERQWWRHAGAKEQAIRDRFGLSATRYYQVLNALLDTPAALAHDPVLVGRLRRLRASRSRRSSG